MMPSAFILVAVLYSFKGTVGLAPEFLDVISNVTISQGRDASFACSVKNLGGFKVAWIKSDTKAILAIHDHVITNNDRLDVTHNDKDTWTLTLRSVQTEDRGPYMCQVNSTPVRKQIAHLEVVIPPRIVDSLSSSDDSVPEGGTAKLTCIAEGFPRPEVVWRRGDGQMITVKTNGKKRKSMEISGSTLELKSVTRSEMGSYMCIARNGVPPAVSKHIHLNVNFQPQISSQQQLVGAPAGTEIKLICIAEASPRPINYWTFGTGEMIVPNEKFKMEEVDESSYRFMITLTIKNLIPPDFGSFRCISKNSIGQAEEYIELYEFKTIPTYSVFSPEPEPQSGEDTRNEVALTPTDRPGIPGKQTHIYSDRKKES
ncbi:protein amalgam [Eurytemora carolleeae]|uniref:protein amalgam n=1 Tax=Eurytemora carolleeae TaxID=1294199 RepID=UPI000C787DD7|nr:protein amalgam [Eurytemora carolleeae]|eukprot:XP_023337364.1 protein amalgam-like [Eurytemora affinis]